MLPLSPPKLSSGIGVYSIVLEKTGIDQGAYSLHTLQDEDITAHGMQCGKVQTTPCHMQKSGRCAHRTDGYLEEKGKGVFL